MSLLGSKRPLPPGSDCVPSEVRSSSPRSSRRQAGPLVEVAPAAVQRCCDKPDRLIVPPREAAPESFRPRRTDPCKLRT